MAMTQAFLKRSRALWVKRERTYKAKAKHAHEMHKRREQQLAALRPTVAPPLKVILTDAWGYHPPVHDGIDLVCPASSPLYAICKATVVRADAGGWWGKGAPADPVLRAKGDGIIVLRALVDAGPIKRGMNLCYGHAEGAVVKVGQTVQAGDRIGTAGFANAWHTHFMVNQRADAKGVGDQDPRPIVDFSRGL